MSDSNIDQLGSFYLGREHSLKTGKTDSAKPLLYDSRDLTTHAVCVGMTGSGKTGLCLSLLEEAALDGIPSIAIDPKGDLSNLLLAFPKLEVRDFRPWVEASEAARQQMSPDDFAAKQADLWRTGLAKWDEGPDRIQKYCDATERVIYTPGSSAGIPITVLKSFRAPPKEFVADDDAFRERVSSATSGLLALLGIDADPVRSREHIFLSSVLDTAWCAGKDLDVPQLIRQLREPPFSKIGVVDLESFYPAADRAKLSMSLNNLLASPSFASWLEGETLDIAKMLYTPTGKPRMAIVSIAHLDDAQRMFFVTILLNEILAWIRTQPGTSSLRALLYMDEVFGYFPPSATPPSKRPMLTLLKQARAFGLGCVLATQNPVDLDYKGLSNAGTWFLGRLQTERDKARVLEGLEGASTQAGAQFDRQKMEATLAGLGSRIFLMNNVHNDTPIVFESRWAMSYLRGPLTREQIKTLMDPLRAEFGGKAAPDDAASADGKPADGKIARKPATATNRPILPAGIREEFVTVSGRVPDGFQLQYRPALVGKAKVHFVRAPDKIDIWRECFLLQEMHAASADDVWDGAAVYSQPLETDKQPDDEGAFAELPTELAREKSYAIFQRQLAEHLYREQSLQLFTCSELGELSRPNEKEGEFRTRLEPLANARREPEKDRVKKLYAKKLDEADNQVARQQARVSTQKWQFFARIGGFLWSVAEMALRFKGMGGRGRARSPEVAIRQAAEERGQQTNAQLSLDKATQEKQRLEEELEQKLREVDISFTASTLKLEPIEVQARKTDIQVDRVSLVWLPWRVDGSERAERVFQLPGSDADAVAADSSLSKSPK